MESFLGIVVNDVLTLGFLDARNFSRTFDDQCLLNQVRAMSKAVLLLLRKADEDGPFAPRLCNSGVA
jgi:hypothetical protein